ncbi:MAG: GIY-YIG nuclease family protein, partial [Arcobacter sp.]|nr:GIY-YIG nuclease family protein [Arcobacter sp.]
MLPGVHSNQNLGSLPPGVGPIRIVEYDSHCREVVILNDKSKTGNKNRYQICTKSEFNLAVDRNVRCQRRRALCCPFFNTNPFFRSTVTNKVFVNLELNKVSCIDKNVIYLITCKKCSLQYVGQTIRKLSTRISEHKNSVNQNKLNTILVKHFGQNGHTVEDLSFQIIDQVNPLMTKNETQYILNEREDFWMRSLGTVFPFGLNNRVSGVGDVESCDVFSSLKQPFFSIKLPRKRGKHSHGKKRRRSKKLDLNAINNLEQLLSENLWSQVYSYLNSFSICTLKYWQGRTLDNFDFSGKIFKAYLCSKVKLSKNVIHKKVSFDTVSVSYLNKGLEFLNCSRFFNNKYGRSLLPGTEDSFRKVRIVYTYNRPLSDKIFNYSYFLKNLKVSDVQQILSSNCSCFSSPYCDKNLGHIVTGNTGLCGDSSFMELLNFGTKFRLPTEIDFDAIESEILAKCVIYIEKLSVQKHLCFDKFDKY